MRYLIFSDLANTLSDNSLIFSNQQITRINNLINDDIKLIILTEEPFSSLHKIITDNFLKCDYFSTSSLIGSIDGKIISNVIPLDSIKFIFEKYKTNIYTSCLMYKDHNNVINHLDRLESIYPSSYEIINNPITPPTEVLIAIDNQVLKNFINDIEMLSIKYSMIGSDLKRSILRLAKTTPTKEAILKKLINHFKSKKTIGIGDSYCDYDFIKYCDIKIAIKSHDERLTKLCDYTTTSYEVIDLLNNICHLKKV